MQIKNIQGNTTIKHALETQLSSGTLPHAILLSAPNGCGRGFVARCLAADYLYPNDPTLSNTVLHCQNPEFIVVQGEGKSGQIPVDSIREIKQDIYRSALSANGRVIWIKDAHRMATPSANALLKVLEEPPENVLFILTTNDASSLPVTILSRCTVYSLTPAPKEDCEETLRTFAKTQENISPLLPKTLTILYNGQIGSGLNILKNSERLSIMEDAIQVANAAVANNRYAVLQTFAKYEGKADGDRQKREDFLADLSSILETGLRGVKVEKQFNFSPYDVLPLLPPILQAKQNLSRNIAPKIVFSALSIHLARAK